MWYILSRWSLLKFLFLIVVVRTIIILLLSFLNLLLSFSFSHCSPQSKKSSCYYTFLPSVKWYIGSFQYKCIRYPVWHVSHIARITLHLFICSVDQCVDQIFFFMILLLSIRFIWWKYFLSSGLDCVKIINVYFVNDYSGWWSKSNIL